MSADNWTKCPRCEGERLQKIEETEAKVRDSYGTVAVEEFDRLRREANAIRDAETKETLREDYEIGVTLDPLAKFSVVFNASCSECGWSHHFSHGEHVSDVVKPSGKKRRSR